MAVDVAMARQLLLVFATPERKAFTVAGSDDMEFSPDRGASPVRELCPLKPYRGQMLFTPVPKVDFHEACS